MTPNRYSVKLFIENPDVVHLPAFIPIFQQWIQNHAVEGLLIDVADYKHVHNGPGIILIGYEGDYALDISGGRPGLRYDRKRESPGSLEEGLQETFRLARVASQLLEAEPTLDGKVTFLAGEIELAFLDRLNVPNHPESFQALHTAITCALGNVYPDGVFTLEPGFSDPRRPLTVHITIAQENVSLVR